MNMSISQLLLRWVMNAHAGAIFLVVMLVLLSGCAVKKMPEPVVDLPDVAQGPSVMHFEDGRRGFVLNEVATLDAAARRDFEQAVASFGEEDYETAIELFDRVVESSPGVSAPYIDLAMAYRKIDRPELAEEYLKNALGLIAGHPVASQEYGLLLRGAGRFVEAREIYEQSLKEFPEYLPVRRNLGILCDLFLNDWECALEQYDLYGASSPEDEQVQLWISELRLRLGQ